MTPVGSLVLLTAFASVTVFGLWKLFQLVYHQFTSPMRRLRGPKGTSWVYGNLVDLWNAHSTFPDEWVKLYGSTLRYNGFFYANRLFTMDIRAINHILTNSSDYQKPFLASYTVSRVLGEGLIVVEGAQHRKQRRIMNHAFGPAQIQALTGIFFEKAVQLRDVWLAEIAERSTGTTIATRFDVLLWLSRMTLDVIGLAGFNYILDALNANEKCNELSEALATMIAASQELHILPILQAWFPPLRLIPSDLGHKIRVSQRTMACISKELLSDAKAAARASATEKGEIEKNSLHGRDLLSLLVRANMATDIPESQRLSDEDVLAQVPTFLLAGHETTSTATAWALYRMANAPDIQTKLREELISVGTEILSTDELNALPYLDAVVRETLRLHPSIPNTMRVAMKDDVVPVEKPFTDRNGVVHTSISIRKGDPILISILAINRSKELWGLDAHEFKPERWQNIPEAVSQIPSVWGHQMTFLSGARACIGYRFAVVEMKVLLFTLVRAFKFEPAVPASEIGAKPIVVLRPVLRSDPKSKPQLPLLVKPYKRT